jgi:hypothetical protein
MSELNRGTDVRGSKNSAHEEKIATSKGRKMHMKRYLLFMKKENSAEKGNNALEEKNTS